MTLTVITVLAITLIVPAVFLIRLAAVPVELGSQMPVRNTVYTQR